MYINLDSQKIHYHDQGEGEVVVLLHGFMESVFMWESLAKRLSKNYRVLSVDLPGHGKSERLSSDLSIDHMAKIVQQILDMLAIPQVDIVGHSLGGYIALSFVEQFPDYVKSFILLHSKAAADSEEVKQRRKLGIEMLKQHPKFVVKESINNLFRASTRPSFSKEIAALVSEGQKTFPEAYADALIAMMNRPDRTEILSNDTPKLYIAGKYDPVIPFDTSESEMSFIKNGEKEILEHSGHMGFIEEKEICEKLICNYLDTESK